MSIVEIEPDKSEEVCLVCEHGHLVLVWLWRSEMAEKSGQLPTCSAAIDDPDPDDDEDDLAGWTECDMPTRLLTDDEEAVFRLGGRRELRVYLHQMGRV